MSAFSLLTFNCFGVPGIGTTARLEQVARVLNQADYALACLQEVQTNAYRDLFARGCRTCYPVHAYQQFVHAPKGGLLTLARAPVDHREFILFRERGLWYTPAVMDWILHKGILITRTRIDALPITVLNTHLTANYMGDWRRGNPFAQQEHNELMQIATEVNAQPADHLVIVCGDFNIPRGSWLYDSLLTACPLIDPLADDPRPTFRPHRGMGKQYRAPIDYILYRAPAGLPLRVTAELCFQDKVDIEGRAAYLSDHVGIEARFSLYNLED